MTVGWSIFVTHSKHVLDTRAAVHMPTWAYGWGDREILAAEYDTVPSPNLQPTARSKREPGFRTFYCREHEIPVRRSRNVARKSIEKGLPDDHAGKLTYDPFCRHMLKSLKLRSRLVPLDTRTHVRKIRQSTTLLARCEVHRIDGNNRTVMLLPSFVTMG